MKKQIIITIALLLLLVIGLTIFTRKPKKTPEPQNVTENTTTTPTQTPNNEPTILPSDTEGIPDNIYEDEEPNVTLENVIGVWSIKQDDKFITEGTKVSTSKDFLEILENGVFFTFSQNDVITGDYLSMYKYYSEGKEGKQYLIQNGKFLWCKAGFAGPEGYFANEYFKTTDRIFTHTVSLNENGSMLMETKIDDTKYNEKETKNIIYYPVNVKDEMDHPAIFEAFKHLFTTEENLENIEIEDVENNDSETTSTKK